MKWSSGHKPGVTLRVSLVGLVVALCAIVALVAFLPAIGNTTVDGAKSMLQGNGYVVLAAGEYTSLLNAIQANTTLMTTAASNVLMFNSGVIYLFPDTTAYSVSLTAPITANTFSAWTELKDSNNTTLSSKFSATSGYISDIYIYNVDQGTQANSNWILELAYGGGKTDLARVMFHVDSYASNSGLSISAIKSRLCPSGQTVYYRLMADETANTTVNASFRYFYNLP